MMCPKKYDELLEQEDHFRQKYGVEISLMLTSSPDPHFPGETLHSATMTVTGETYLARDNPVFCSDENGGFYRQIDAMTNARIKLIDWFKKMDEKGFMSYELEHAFIREEGNPVEPNGILSEARAYMEWLADRRAEIREGEWGTEQRREYENEIAAGDSAQAEQSLE